jgi:hypothetical protein
MRFTLIQGYSPSAHHLGRGPRHTTNAMTRNDLLLWTPRILGIAVAVFLSLFALDAFEPGKPIARAAIDFALHLVPAAIVLAIVVLAWRHAWIGGVAFLFLAAAYAMSVRFRLDWIVVISGPLLTAGLLFLWSWRQHRQA